jgi:hypothetical protein
MSQRVTNEEVINQLVIRRDDFNRMFRELEEIPNDPSVDVKARIEAQHLSPEIATAIVKVYQVPDMLASRNELLPYTITELQLQI